jgi:small-conductance mechanosensitive channel
MARFRVSRAAVTTAVEVVGIGGVAVGFWLILPCLGLIAGGLGLILIGWSLA